MRLLLQYLLPLLVSTAIYVLYMAWARRRASAAGYAMPDWTEGPVFWFVVGGLVLLAISLVALYAFDRGAGTGAVYTPARVEGNKVIPGHFGGSAPSAPAPGGEDQ